jgi:low temperature requirement protein LtrA
MTDTSSSSSSVRRRLLTLRARDPQETQRTATPLELFFDLVFVVAVAQAASSLHHAIVEGHPWSGAIGYSMVFFALWWAWMNWTWFASAFDNDDTLYRLVTFVQMFGALVVAAGVSEAFDGRFGVAVAGYVIMRLAQVSQWLRAARANPPWRATALRYAAGITLVQALWVARLAVQGTWSGVAFVVLVVAELAVPWWAERARITPWHPHHIAERYVLLTLIVLGEAVLASTQAVRSALAGGAGLGTLVAVGLSGFVVVCSMWWLYTARPAHRYLRGSREAFSWGYGHYFVFSSIAAFGAGLAALVDAKTGRLEHPDPAVIAAAVAVPVVGFLLSVWAIHVRPQRPGALCSACFLTAALLAAATPLTAAPLELLAVILAATVVATQATRRDPAPASTRES